LEKEIKAEVLADNSTRKEKAYEMSQERGDVPLSSKSEQVSSRTLVQEDDIIK